MLAAILKSKGVSQRAAAKGIGLSAASLNIVCNRGLWPLRNTAAIKARAVEYLETLGVSSEQALAVINDPCLERHPQTQGQGRRRIGLSRPEGDGLQGRLCRPPQTSPIASAPYRK